MRDHGAVLDGVTDSTTQAQAALDAASAAGGGFVDVPGAMKVTSIIHRQKTILAGVGAAGGRPASESPSQIIGTAGVDTIVFDDGGADHTESYGVRDLAVHGGRRSIAILAQGITNLTIRDAVLSGTEAGIYCDTWMERSRFDRVELSGSQYGFQLVDNGTINNYLDKCDFSSVRAAGSVNGFRIESHRACNQNSFTGLVLNNCGEHAFRVAAAMSQTTFINASTEANGYTGPTLAVTTGTISAGSPSLAVASASNLAPGQQVTVRGAGVAGKDLVTTISTLVGTTATLATTATTAVTAAEVTNAIYDEFRFSPASSGGASNYVSWFGALLGSAAAFDRVRYAISGTIYGSVYNSSWSRPVDNSGMTIGFIDSSGPVVEPDALNTTSLVYRRLALGAGRRSVIPGIPGVGTVMALRGSGNGNENTGPYGGVDVVRTDPNRTRMFRLDADSGELIIGNGALYVDAGALKFRSTGGTVTTVAPA